MSGRGGCRPRCIAASQSVQRTPWGKGRRAMSVAEVRRPRRFPRRPFVRFPSFPSPVRCLVLPLTEKSAGPDSQLFHDGQSELPRVSKFQPDPVAPSHPTNPLRTHSAEPNPQTPAPPASAHAPPRYAQPRCQRPRAARRTQAATEKPPASRNPDAPAANPVRNRRVFLFIIFSLPSP